MSSPIMAIVPTLGLSPLLGRCLDALRADGGERIRVVLVHQGSRPLPIRDDLRASLHDVVVLERNLGFAGGVNAGLEGRDSETVALVNDDVVVERGWSQVLLNVLDREPLAAAAQGINLLTDGRPGDSCGGDSAAAAIVDSMGLALNGWLQAIQIAHGRKLNEVQVPSQPSEVLGVSAAAAIYRRRALNRAAIEGHILDQRLVSHYEDVDLACRLRTLGYTAWLAPAARAKHTASTTGRRDPRLRTTQVYGNRWLVASRLLGRAFPAAVPRLLLRDLIDLGHALSSDADFTPAGIVAGWFRALRWLPRFAHPGAPLLRREERLRFALQAGDPGR